MLAPLKDRSILRQATADDTSSGEELAERLATLEDENRALKLALRATRQQLRRNATEHTRTLVAQSNEISRLKLVAEQRQAAVDHLVSGQAMIEMGRRLVALSEANERLVQAARRVWHLDKTIGQAHRECERLARERDYLAERLYRGATDAATELSVS